MLSHTILVSLIAMYLNINEVLAKVPYSRASIYRLMGEDKFPRPVVFGPKKVGWRPSDVKAWLAQFDPMAVVTKDAELEDLLS